MGIKYQPKVKDRKLDQRYQVLNQQAGVPATQPGQRTPKKLTRKEAARRAANETPPEQK